MAKLVWKQTIILDDEVVEVEGWDDHNIVIAWLDKAQSVEISDAAAIKVAAVIREYVPG